MVTTVRLARWAAGGVPYTASMYNEPNYGMLRDCGPPYRLLYWVSFALACG